MPLTSRRSAISRTALWLAGATLANTMKSFGQPNSASSKAPQPTIFVTGGTFPGQHNADFAVYLLRLAANKSPSICYIGAAAGDASEDFQEFQRGMSGLPCQLTHFDIFNPSTMDFVPYFRTFDIIFVGGGSTRNLLALWRDWGIDQALVTAWQQGVILSGSSAGALCWFDSGLTDSYRKVLGPVKGVGILPGSADVHHHNRPDRAARFRELIASGLMPSPGLALDEDAAVLFHGRMLIEVVTCNRSAGAAELTQTKDGLMENALNTRFLGS